LYNDYVTQNNHSSIKPGTKGYVPVTLDTERGGVNCRFYSLGNEKQSVVYVGGMGGGFDTPAKGLYPKLCHGLLSRGVSGLRIKFRNPVNLRECIFDVTAGMNFLRSRSVDTIGLVGHSLGGAVVIQAGARSDKVKTIVTLSTQSYGAEKVAGLTGKSILLIHGMDDTVLPYSSSVLIHRMASVPKKLVLLEKTGHVLDEKADEVYDLVFSWLVRNLG
jgi:alpha/beta superfamily hydrolase